MARNQPLVIPGVDGDNYRDVNAAAAYLGVSVSTLRSHQYQDANKAHPAGSTQYPKPVDPDDVEIELPIGAQVQWAYAIEELMLRAGGSGLPVRLWRTSDLDAFIEARDGAPNVVAVNITDEMREAWAKQDAEDNQRLADAMREKIETDPKALKVNLDGELIGIERTGNTPEMDAFLYGESFTDEAGASYKRVDNIDVKGLSFSGAVIERFDKPPIQLGEGVIVPLRDGQGGPQIGTAEVHQDGTVHAKVTDPEVKKKLAPVVREGDIDALPVAYARQGGKTSAMEAFVQDLAERDPEAVVVQVAREGEPKRLTAREVLEQARLRREGKA